MKYEHDDQLFFFKKRCLTIFKTKEKHLVVPIQSWGIMPKALSFLTTVCCEFYDI